MSWREARWHWIFHFHRQVLMTLQEFARHWSTSTNRRWPTQQVFTVVPCPSFIFAQCSWLAFLSAGRLLFGLVLFSRLIELITVPLTFIDVIFLRSGNCACMRVHFIYSYFWASVIQRFYYTCFVCWINGGFCASMLLFQWCLLVLCRKIYNTKCADRQAFNSLFSRTTWISRHQKGTGKPFWILMKQDVMGWQWHQLDHMQIICMSLQTDNHVSTASLDICKPDALPVAKATVSSTEGNP